MRQTYARLLALALIMLALLLALGFAAYVNAATPPHAASLGFFRGMAGTWPGPWC
ncbi:hypothetical protein [Yoonia vestfoldensis]|jgi:Spy/CpxP family protein refolding chaperone|uniref:Uncharacterized protein n=1 Tax=Yoonia vestfoldensis TaxID=245188 RepID=A0A1Y0E9K8_9RHOB|nr:hypothetical protein [Yoonia vestfoldensis]ARU00294.1 hypothetical protein LOKVESSMR4R_00963 [Yoonia vestfoldensis]